MQRRLPSVWFIFLCFTLLLNGCEQQASPTASQTDALAQDDAGSAVIVDNEDRANWDVTIPRGEPRRIRFETDQSTFMSITASPDGRHLVFDLLGHLYQVSTKGGESTA